jgi:hypothetical protein
LDCASAQETITKIASTTRRNIPRTYQSASALHIVKRLRGFKQFYHPEK